MTEIIVVHMWSSPRSRSTATMYSFSARDDTVAVDEPLYREWLLKNKHAERPYKDLLLNGDGDKWDREQVPFHERLAKIIESIDGDTKNIIFCKHMAKHHSVFDFDKNSEIGSYTSLVNNSNVRHVHVLLLRSPTEILSSWKAASENHGNSQKADEVGVLPLLSVYSELTSRSYSPIVVDSNEIATKPSDTLQLLCDSIGIPFTEKMLKWDSGPKECDGAWASFWYKSAHLSSGWNISSDKEESITAENKYKTLDPKLMPLLRLSFSPYQYLKSLSITKKETHTKFLNQDLEDPKNADVLVWIGPPESHGGGQLYPREMASISPFDSAVQGGDAVWEGLRIYNGKILSLEEHLQRLFNSSKAMGFKNIHSKEEVKEAIFTTLAANGMRNNAHIRLTLTRGVKCTSSMNPNFNLYGTTLIVLAEWKPVVGRTTYDSSGISLITAANRRNPPSTVDSKIHHNNLINNILPKIQANHAGAADAIMLDLDGFVSETNATNIFMVDHNGKLITPHADHCLPGITRSTVLWIAREECKIPVEERRVSLAEFHAAEEVFTTGTMGGLSPVKCIDGRVIGSSGRVGPGPLTQQLQKVYKTLPDRPGWSTDIPPFS